MLLKSSYRLFCKLASKSQLKVKIKLQNIKKYKNVRCEFSLFYKKSIFFGPQKMHITANLDFIFKKWNFLAIFGGIYWVIFFCKIKNLDVFRRNFFASDIFDILKFDF